MIKLNYLQRNYASASFGKDIKEENCYLEGLAALLPHPFQKEKFKP